MQLFIIQYGEDKTRKKLRKCCKSYHTHGKKTSLYFYFFDAFFFEACSEAGCNCSLFNMGKTKPERSPESVAKATKRMAKKTSLYFFFYAFVLKAESEAGCKCSKLNRMPTKRRGKPTKSVAKATTRMAKNLMARFS